jgi:transcriptional regulator with XRE-family HTH domain
MSSSKDTKTRFKAILKRCNLTHKDVGDITGFNSDYISQVLSGNNRRLPRWVNLVVKIYEILIENKEYTKK